VWDGAAGFLEAREVPQVRKIPALLRLHRLDGTIVDVEEDTLATGFLFEGQATSILGEAGEALDELDLT
jgi:hypothetical protein